MKPKFSPGLAVPLSPKASFLLPSLRAKFEAANPYPGPPPLRTRTSASFLLLRPLFPPPPARGLRKGPRGLLVPSEPP